VDATLISSAIAGAGGGVLVVDDDQEMCETLTACLDRRGFTVAWRTSPAAALVLLEGEDFDAIVTDFQMGEMDGLAFCRRVVVMRPGLPVILATAFGTTAIGVAALEAGAFEFMTKPFDVEKLRLALGRAVLAGRSARPGRAPH